MLKQLVIFLLICSPLMAFDPYAMRPPILNSTGTAAGPNYNIVPSLIEPTFIFFNPSSGVNKWEAAKLDSANGLVWDSATNKLKIDSATMPTPAAADARMNDMEDLWALVPVDSAAYLSETDFDSAGSASAAQAYAIQRSNHTGTQSAGTITGLAPVATSGAYSDLTGKPSTFTPSAHTHAWSDITSGKPTTLSGYGITDAYPLSGNPSGFLTVEVDGSTTNEIELPSQAGQSGKVLTTNGAAVSWGTVANGTVTSVGISSTTLTVSGSPITSSGSITINTPARAFSAATRTLNSAFGPIDASRDALVSYTVDVGATLTLTAGATGTVTLQYADDSGMSTNLVTVQSSVNGNAGTLVVGLSLTQTSTAALTGVIPAGKYVRIATANTTGTPTFTYRAGQEVKL